MLNTSRLIQKVQKFCHPSCIRHVRAHHAGKSHAVVIGCYKTEDNGFKLTDSGEHVQNIVGTNLSDLLSMSNFKADAGKNRTFYNLHNDYPCITVAGLGNKDVPYNKTEAIDQDKENVRLGIGNAVTVLKNNEFNSVSVDSCGAPSASAEGAHLGNYVFDKFKSEKKEIMEIELLRTNDNINSEEWEKGVIAAGSQNFARHLMETPSNHKFPLMFADIISEKFSTNPNVQMFVRDEAWAEAKNMECFLSVGRGSVNRSAMLELHYKGADTKPVVLVGKGITFDSGGISIKPSQGMGLMRGDMGGAACVLSTFDAVVKMNLPLNLVVLVALAENMPSGSATKPGDVFTAMNGKSVEVDNTDAEGRLVLADALCYADEFNPSFIIDAATLTGAMDVALGAGATGTFTTCNTLWSHLHDAGRTTGDRMWRMPLFDHYTKQMKCSLTADLRNTQKKARSAGSCTAANFLKEFVTIKRWAHLDIAGVMDDGMVPYISAGMSGRPTRTLIETVNRISRDERIQHKLN